MAAAQTEMHVLLNARRVAINPAIRVELLRGARDEDAYVLLRGRLAAVPVLEPDARVWSRCERMGYDLRRRGVSAAVVDLLIAATAIEHNVALYHLDRDFDAISAHTPLRIYRPRRTSSK